jgi:hypothetical protein
LLRSRLDLQPVWRAPAGLVSTRFAFRYNPFEPSVLRELEEGFPVILNVPSDLNPSLGSDNLLQPFPSLHNGFAG